LAQDLLPPDVISLMAPDAVAPGLLYLVSEDAPSCTILDATTGRFAHPFRSKTEGVFWAPADNTPENVAAQFAAISDQTGAPACTDDGGQVMMLVGKAAAARVTSGI
jgi:hypothetical protein